jgi:hypothetical protein
MISETLLQLQPDRESLLLYRSAPPLSPCEERAWFHNIDTVLDTTELNRNSTTETSGYLI